MMSVGSVLNKEALNAKEGSRTDLEITVIFLRNDYLTDIWAYLQKSSCLELREMAMPICL